MRYQYQLFEEYAKELKALNLASAMLSTQYLRDDPYNWSTVLEIDAADKKGDVHVFLEVERASIPNQAAFDEFKKAQDKKQDKFITELQDKVPGIKILMGKIV